MQKNECLVICDGKVTEVGFLFMELNLINKNVWMLGDKQIDQPTSGILVFDKFFHKYFILP